MSEQDNKQDSNCCEGLSGRKYFPGGAFAV